MEVASRSDRFTPHAANKKAFEQVERESKPGLPHVRSYPSRESKVARSKANHSPYRLTRLDSRHFLWKS